MQYAILISYHAILYISYHVWPYKTGDGDRGQLKIEKSEGLFQMLATPTNADMSVQTEKTHSW